MSKAKATELRKQWEEKGPKTLKLNHRPISDMLEDKLAQDSVLILNIKLRLRHLAEVLELLHKIYYRNINTNDSDMVNELYGENFLAFVGDKVIRHWPWKDFLFISEQAFELLKENTETINSIKISKKLITQIKDKKIKYEHWTPISFFRDVFHLSKTPLDANTFYYLLIEYYRVVLVSEEENKLINEKHKSSRKIGTYDELGIKISNKDIAWQQLRDEN